MSLTQLEVRLIATLDRAEQAVKDLRTTRDDVMKLHSSLTKHQQEQKDMLLAKCAEAVSLSKMLRHDAHEAREQLGYIQAHKKWKAAVLELFGQEGVEACIAHMYAAKVVEQQGEPA